MIKQGEVAFLKTTGEAVFVLGTYDSGDWHVRRPKAGQDGIDHVEESFTDAELESLEEQQARFMSERKKVMDKFGPKTEQSPSEDFGSIIN